MYVVELRFVYCDAHALWSRILNPYCGPVAIEMLSRDNSIAQRQIFYPYPCAADSLSGQTDAVRKRQVPWDGYARYSAETIALV